MDHPRDITIREDNEVPYSKECFLANTHNKTELVSFISDNLTKDGQRVHVCKGDADTKIAKCCSLVSTLIPDRLVTASWTAAV